MTDSAVAWMGIIGVPVVVAVIYNAIFRNPLVATTLAVPSSLLVNFFFGAGRTDAFWPFAVWPAGAIALFCSLVVAVLAYGIREAVAPPSDHRRL